MNKILLINKPIGLTSRDVVNIISKAYNTKKVGHFGTLDPLATGLLVIGIGKYTKLVNFLKEDTKEYIVEVLVGVATDTYDITGNIVSKSDKKLDKVTLIKALNSFKKTYMQEVPIYSAVKVNGEKLYNYARNKKSVKLPKKEVTIFDIELLEVNKDTFKFRVLVSKGTYIRSLINDLSKEILIPLTMKGLVRTKQDIFKLSDADTLEDIEKGRAHLYDFEDIFNVEKEELTNDNYKKIINGCKVISKKDSLLYTKDNKNIVLYKGDGKELKPFIFFEE